ncbi:MAG: S8 family serine peptidase [candidate division WOR-3 bacterium]
MGTFQIIISLYFLSITPYWIHNINPQNMVSLSKWIEEMGGRKRVISKLINSSSFFIPEKEALNLQNFLNVKKVERFKRLSENLSPLNIQELVYEDYLKILNVNKVHEKGILGDNVKIGILDAGFDFIHPALKHLAKPEYKRILHTHDFASGDHLFIKFPLNVFYEINYNQAGVAYINSFDLKKIQNEAIIFYSYSHDSILYAQNQFQRNFWKIYACKVNEIGEFTFPPKLIKRDTFAIKPSFEISNNEINLVYKTRRGNFKLHFSKISIDSLNLFSDTIIYSSKIIINPYILNAFNKLNIFLIDTQGFKVLYSQDGGNIWNEKLIFEGKYTDYKIEKSENGFKGVCIKGVPWEEDSIILFGIDSLFNQLFSKKIEKGVEPEIILKDDTINLCYFNYKNLIFSKFLDTILLYQSIVDSGDFIYSPEFYFEGNEIKLIYSKEGATFSYSLISHIINEIGFFYTDLIKSDGNALIIRRRGDDIVTFEAEKDYDFNSFSHGARVLSVIAGMGGLELTGVSPASKFILARTERTMNLYGNEFENIIEEDFWVEGLEWAISKGAQIINSSLGYILWWNKKDADGKTSPASIAASKAIKKNVLVVNAIGNLGENEFHSQIGVPDTTLHIPSDADSIITVGGIVVGDSIYVHEKSCYGPAADGRKKPDVVAPWSAKVAYVYFESYGTQIDTIIGYAYSEGTSYSTAIVTGICALALSAHPSWDARKLIKYLKQTSHLLRDTADNISGWGYPDAERLVFIEKPEIPIPKEKIESDRLLSPYPNPTEFDYINFPFIIVEGESYVEFKIYDISGNLIFEKNFELLDCGKHVFKWNLKNKNGKKVDPGNYIAVLKTSFNTSYKKFSVVK